LPTKGRVIHRPGRRGRSTLQGPVNSPGGWRSGWCLSGSLATPCALGHHSGQAEEPGRGQPCAVPEEAVMAAHIDEEALQSSLQRLREAAFDADVAGVMRRTVDAAHGVFGYGGAGIMFITESGDLSYVAASDEAGRQLEEAQASAGQGPCYESYVYATEVASADLHADDRWPDLPIHLLPQVRAVAGIPLLLSGSPVGTLNVYRDQPAEWDGSDIQALRAYSDLIAEVVGAALAAQAHSVLADQLRYALDYRVVIERAVGY